MPLPVSITEQIDEIRTQDITYKSMHEQAIVKDKYSGNNLRVPYDSLTNKYRHLLANIVAHAELSEEEKKKYWYKPKTLSEDLYGSTELWHDLLILNNAYTLLQFTPNVVYFYDPESYKEYINEIMIIEGIM